LSHITNDFISNDEIINGVVTINPHTHSPPHRLISSSSTSSNSTASSASTVLLSNNNNTLHPVSSNVAKTPSTTNNNLTKNNNKTISQLPKRTITTVTNVSRLKQPSKVVPSTSKLKPPSLTISKPIKSMIANGTGATTTMTMTSMRKPTGITNQSSPMTNCIVNKPVRVHT
jgi:hypothetical protein